MKIQVKFIDDRKGTLLFGANITDCSTLEEAVLRFQSEFGGIIFSDYIVNATFKNKKNVFIDFKVL